MQTKRVKPPFNGQPFFRAEAHMWPMDGYYVLRVDGHIAVAEFISGNWYPTGCDYDPWHNGEDIRVLYRINTENGCHLRKLRTESDLVSQLPVKAAQA